MMKREGLVLGMSEDEYHGGKNELSSTGAKLILECAAKYKHQVIDGNREHKAAYDIGTVVHTKVLGVGAAAVTCPAEYLDVNGGMRTAKAKAWKAEQVAAGRPVLKADEIAQADAMAESVLAHPLARELFERPGNAEVSMFDEVDGVRRRGRFDYLPDEGGVAVDLKTTINASRKSFAYSAADYGYHIQRAHYLDMLYRITGRELDMRFVLVEKTAPYAVAVHPMNEQFIEIGVAEALEAITVYRRCMAENHWPSYPMDMRPAEPPMGLIYDYQDKYENGEITL